jgi:predicted nucleotidyltransferase
MNDESFHALLGVHAEQVAALCRALGVSKLSLFGSALTDRFNADSDVDLLVEFKLGAVETLLDRGRIQMEFERLLGRKVDLVELRLVDNPVRRREILSKHQEIYSA